MKKIILLSTLTILGVLILGPAVYAADSNLSILPSTLSATVGVPFNVSVQLNPADSKVCVVTGTINFNGLTCQSITVAGGLMAPTVPTCASPNFIIGIPKCTTTVQNIFSISIKGNQVGQSTLSFSGIKVIGVGSNVSSIWQGGAYNIAAVKTTKPTAITTPSEEVTPAETQEVQTPVEKTTLENNIPTGVGAAVGQQASLVTASPTRTITIIVIVLLVIVVIGGGWYIISKKKKK